jgi:co-chaperonin GroES (HSP10)
MISPAADNLLVKVIPGSPFDHAADYKIEAVSQGPPLPPVCGEVLAIGPSPYIPDDEQDQDERVDVGDIVLFPPTSGFVIPPGRSSNEEYRIIRASAIAGKINLEKTKDAS